jgi:hypothetical protein
MTQGAARMAAARKDNLTKNKEFLPDRIRSLPAGGEQADDPSA